MAQVLIGFLVLAAGVLIGIYWAWKEDDRRAKEKPKMNIPKEVDESLDWWEKKIS